MVGGERFLGLIDKLFEVKDVVGRIVKGEFDVVVIGVFVVVVE